MSDSVNRILANVKICRQDEQFSSLSYLDSRTVNLCQKTLLKLTPLAMFHCFIATQISFQARL